MRIQLTLHFKGPFAITLNYNHAIQSLIYSFISNADQEHFRFVHDQGYQLGHRRFKGFCFSSLHSPGSKQVDSFLHLGESRASFFVSSPHEQTIHAIMAGALDGKYSLCDHEIAMIEARVLPPVEYMSRSNYYLAASPITIKERNTLTPRNGNVRKINTLLNRNMTNKFKALGFSGEFYLALDQNYIDRKAKKNERITKSIKVKKNTAIGFKCPVFVNADRETEQTILDLGIGSRNSMGFGFLQGV